MFKKGKKGKKAENMEMRADYDDFNGVMEAAELMVENAAAYEEKIAVYDFLSEVLKRELQSDFLTRCIYKDKPDDRIINIFPTHYDDENGIKHQFHCCDEKKQKIYVDFAKTYVFVVPWSRTKLGKSIGEVLHRGFVHKPQNESSYYYSYLDFCQVHNGNHHTAAAVSQHKGYTASYIVSIVPTFQHVKTDGERWLNIHTGEEIGLVSNFRIAAIYELSKRKYAVERQTEPRSGDDEIMRELIQNSILRIEPALFEIAPYSLLDYPDGMKSYDVCFRAVCSIRGNARKPSTILSGVPLCFRDYSMCMEAVKRDGNNIKDVPLRICSEELCLEAVKNRGSALFFVPEYLRTKDVCRAAAKEDNEAVFYVPMELLDADMIHRAVQESEIIRHYVNIHRPKLAEV